MAQSKANLQKLSAGHVPNDGFTTITQVIMWIIGTVSLPIIWIAGTMESWYPWVYLFFTGYLAWELYEYLHGLQDIYFGAQGLYGDRANSIRMIAYTDIQSVQIKERKNKSVLRISFLRASHRPWFITFDVYDTDALHRFRKQLQKRHVPITHTS